MDRDGMTRFFRMCGIRRQIGVPLSEDMRRTAGMEAEQALEPEAERLARNIAELGDAELDSPASWDLHLTDGGACAGGGGDCGGGRASGDCGERGDQGAVEGLGAGELAGAAGSAGRALSGSMGWCWLERVRRVRPVSLRRRVGGGNRRWAGGECLWEADSSGECCGVCAGSAVHGA